MPASRSAAQLPEKNMSKTDGAAAPLSAIAIAKKYRISIEDAKTILAEHSDDVKAIHKAARRIAA